MVKQSSYKSFKNAKLYVIYSLAFLVLAFFYACNHPSQKLEIIWKDQQAIGISIPKNKANRDSLKIVRQGTSNQQIFGSFTKDGGRMVFHPIIPFTSGLTYEVWNGKDLIGQLTVPLPDPKFAPVLQSIYPERDTLPENLLKFYFHFSKSMRTGQSLNYISLLDKNGDTMQHVFLNLQPELWDTTGKILTIWLDPGRIKRNLVLNKKLGNPLIKNGNYQLIVSSKWKDVQGLSLVKNYVKSFVVGLVDHQKIDINLWDLSIPRVDTREPLIVDAKEPLDHFLFTESLVLIDEQGQIVKGDITILNDQIWKFTPFKAWKPKRFRLQVNARLEDLAANNLNKIFDRDIRKEKGNNNVVVNREFSLKP